MSAVTAPASMANDKARSALYRRRGITNIIAIVLACAAALFGLAFLGWILWTLLAKGLIERSTTLESISIRPSSRKRLKPFQCESA